LIHSRSHAWTSSLRPLGTSFTTTPTPTCQKAAPFPRGPEIVTAVRW